MSLADEENVQPLLSPQDVHTGEDRQAPPHAEEEPVPEPPPEEEEAS